jgi:hypothetical protein
MNKTVEVTFESDNLSDVREKIKAFETLYETSPDVFVHGEVFSFKDKDGNYHSDIEEAVLFNLDGIGGYWTKVRNIKHKYFSAKYDGKLDSKLMPSSAEKLVESRPINYGEDDYYLENVASDKEKRRILNNDPEEDVEPTKWKLEARIEL